MKFNGRNIHIGKNVTLGKNVRIGDNTIIYDNVVIGDDTVICENCVLGEPIASYYHDDSYTNPPLTIGKNSLIRSFSIFYAGSTIGDHLQTGHHVTVREHAKIGVHCQIGSYGDIQGLCNLGDYVRMQSYVTIGQFSKIGNYVFLYPYTVLTNDPTPPSFSECGVSIDDFSVVSTGCVMLPGAVIGKHCLISAHSTVGGAYQDYSFVSGSPARKLCDIRRAPLFDEKTGKRHYPWPNNFDRHMPWEGKDFSWWQNSQDQ